MNKLTDKQLLGAIIKHGLAVRRIPLEQVTYLPQTQRGEPFAPKIDKSVYASWSSEVVTVRRRVPEGVLLRKMIRYTRVPKQAGWWMRRPVSHLGGTVSWNQDETPPQRTLELAVRRCLEKNKLRPPVAKSRAKSAKLR